MYLQQLPLAASPRSEASMDQRARMRPSLLPIQKPEGPFALEYKNRGDSLVKLPIMKTQEPYKRAPPHRSSRSF